MAPNSADYSDSDYPSDTEAPPLLLSNPRPDHKLASQFDSLDNLVEAPEDFGRLTGFGVYKMRSNNYVKGFGLTRIDATAPAVGTILW